MPAWWEPIKRYVCDDDDDEAVEASCLRCCRSLFVVAYSPSFSFLAAIAAAAAAGAAGGGQPTAPAPKWKEARSESERGQRASLGL